MNHFGAAHGDLESFIVVFGRPATYGALSPRPSIKLS
jgi:hypothetical protein